MMFLNYSVSCVPVFSRVGPIDALVRKSMITAAVTDKMDVNE